MFYEIELLHTYIDGIINTMETVDNPENVYLDFTFNTSQFFEKIDTSQVSEGTLRSRFLTEIARLTSDVVSLEKCEWRIISDDDNVYTQTNYRRELNTKYCSLTDYIIWGETDSILPKETFSSLEALRDHTDMNGLHRFVVSFADRKMWDSSWDVLVHSDYEEFVYDEATAMTDSRFAKSPMSVDEMNSVNEKITDYDFRLLDYPKIDGSCLVITSDLIKSGVNIPPCFVHNDDEAFANIAKLICGPKYLQIVCKNVLKVHARRHPRKRLYVAGEDNPRGLCGDEHKGNWWSNFKKLSKSNISNMFTSQERFYTFDDLKKL